VVFELDQNDKPMTSMAVSSSPVRLCMLTPSWPVIVAILAVLGCCAYFPASQMLSDGDTYWHLAAGLWMLERGAFAHTDPFSHTLAGAPWTAHEWLAEIVMALVHRYGSWMGLVAMVGLAYGLALARLTQFLLRRMEPVHALLFVAFSAAMSMPHLLARPHLLAWVALVVWVAELIEASEAQRTPPWWLLALMVVWANLHGSFTLGLALAGAFAVEAVWAHPPGERRATGLRWGVFLLAVTGSAMLTPHGWQALWFTAQVMQMKFMLANIGEWQSPNFQLFQPVQFWLLLVLLVALRGRMVLPWLRIALLLGLMHLALKHQRNVAVLGLLSPMLIAAPWALGWYSGGHRGKDAEALDRLFRGLAVPLSAAAAWGWSLAIGVAIAGVVHWRTVSPDISNTPEAAVAAALASRPQGPVLNTYEFGGYLIYRGIPVFVDGRADVYGDDFLKTYVEALRLRKPGDFEALLERHKIGWTLLSPGAPAVALLDLLPGWRRLYADETAVVHVRAGQ
jgi:hypothetical protein